MKKEKEKKEGILPRNRYWHGRDQLWWYLWWHRKLFAKTEEYPLMRW